MRLNQKYGKLQEYPQFFEWIDNDEFEYTEFFRYTAARKAKDFFAEIIKELDTENRYTRATTKEFKDYEATDAQMAPYKDKLEQVQEKFNKYKSDNPDEFESSWRIDTQGEGGAGINITLDKKQFSLEDAVQGYLLAKDILNEIDDEYIPHYEAIISKAEFADKHKNLRKQYMEELEIPEFEPIYKLETRTQLKRFKKEDTVIYTEEPFNIFCESIIEDIVNR